MIKQTMAIIVITIFLITGFFINPISLSYLTGVPIHFNGLDKDSTREDVIDTYGESVGTTPHGNELYEAEFLSVRGQIWVQYFENTDRVFLIHFVIKSIDYDSYDDYMRDANKTRTYFENVLLRMKKSHGKLKNSIHWENDDECIVFDVYESNVYYDENGSHFLEDGNVTIFQFNNTCVEA